MRSHIAMATQQPDLVTSQAIMTSPAGSMTSLDTKPSPICNLCFLPFPDIGKFIYYCHQSSCFVFSDHTVVESKDFVDKK